MKPLEGLFVLDFTHGVAGPFATMLMADLGADVVKIEKPGRGDATRYLNVSEKFATDIPNSGGDYFLAINRNKRAITIDLSVPDGVQLALRLAEKADVVIQNFRPGVMTRLGLDYEAVRAVNSRVIYASISGYGESGPLASHPGMDVVVQARSGVMSITGYPGSEPVKCGVSLADFSAGVHMCTGVLAALLVLARTGEGQEVSVSLLDATMIMLVNYSVAVLDGGAEIGPMGSGHPQLVPFGAFPTSDGHIVLGTGTNKLFAEFCNTVLGVPELAQDPRFSSNQHRVRHRAEVEEIIAGVTRTKPTQYWIRQLEKAGIPCGPVNSLKEAFEEPQLKANDMIVEVQHAVYGALHLLGVPYKFSKTECTVERPPPRLGEHTAEVLRERLGMTSQEVLATCQAGVVSQL